MALIVKKRFNSSTYGTGHLFVSTVNYSGEDYANHMVVFPDSHTVFQCINHFDQEFRTQATMQNEIILMPGHKEFLMFANMDWLASLPAPPGALDLLKMIKRAAVEVVKEVTQNLHTNED